MILTLTIECVFGLYLEEKWVRIIEIDEEASLYDLHDFIQDTVEFERDHPFGFYIANSASPWAKKRWVTDAEEWQDAEYDFQSITLQDRYPLNRKRL